MEQRYRFGYGGNPSAQELSVLTSTGRKKTLESAISIRLIADVKSKIHRDYSQF
jgi:hypothetical protein